MVLRLMPSSSLVVIAQSGPYFVFLCPQWTFSHEHGLTFTHEYSTGLRPICIKGVSVSLNVFRAFVLPISSFLIFSDPLNMSTSHSTGPNSPNGMDMDSLREAVLLQMDLGESHYMNAWDLCPTSPPDPRDPYHVHETWARKQVALLVCPGYTFLVFAETSCF